jgi:hypothetical protein
MTPPTTPTTRRILAAERTLLNGRFQPDLVSSSWPDAPAAIL